MFDRENILECLGILGRVLSWIGLGILTRSMYEFVTFWDGKRPPGVTMILPSWSNVALANTTCLARSGYRVAEWLPITASK